MMEVSNMEKTASTLSEKARSSICEALNEVLADGIDLYTQFKVAHWNIKGPLFSVLHPQFDSFASEINEHNDSIAERAVILGGRALGSARQVAKASRLDEYNHKTTKDLEHVALLVARLGAWAKNLQVAQGVAEKHHDTATVDLLTEVIADLEKKAWFFYATLR
jgi:starvation-inducible DNA-binding protein